MLSLHRPLSRLPLRRFPTARFFASDDGGSHPDFAPQRKDTSKDNSKDNIQSMIAKHVKENPILLYMKGNPQQPMCGFSAKVVNILGKEGVDYSSVNVLDYPMIREGVKQYSDWPTIPQLYVHGEFIGGCDIVTQMHESGDLADLLVDEKEKQQSKPKPH